VTGGAVAGPKDARGYYPDGGATGQFYTQTTLSDDGSRVFFGDATTNQLYVREGLGGASPHTVRVSAPQRPVSGDDPAGTQAAEFRGAATDGSVVLFTSTEKLTEDSTAGGTAPDLYRFDVDAGTLTDLTVAASGSAGVLGVVGTSDDGMTVYFAALGDLAPGATDGNLNIYVSRGGALAFVGDVGDGSASYLVGGPYQDNWIAGSGGPKTGRVSRDGNRVAFISNRKLTAADNGGQFAMYVYDAPSDELTCASCFSDGTPSSGPASILRSNPVGALAFIPSVNRFLSDDGHHVFFNTPDALVRRDINGVGDVYDYDWADGTIELVSSGRSALPSWFEDSSSDGSTVFFVTAERLVGQDIDDNDDAYAAREGGGFAAQNSAPPPIGCSGDGCQPPPSVHPDDTSPASVRPDGSGDIVSTSRPQARIVALSAAQRRAFARKGRATFAVKVNRSGRVALSVRAQIGRKRATVAHSAGSASRAGTVRLVLRLSAAARRQLAKTGRLKLTISASFAGTRPASMALTLRRTPHTPNGHAR
jgi:Tol biopolymer transport system component